MTRLRLGSPSTCQISFASKILPSTPVHVESREFPKLGNPWGRNSMQPCPPPVVLRFTSIQHATSALPATHDVSALILRFTFGCSALYALPFPLYFYAPSSRLDFTFYSFHATFALYLSTLYLFTFYLMLLLYRDRATRAKDVVMRHHRCNCGVPSNMPSVLCISLLPPRSQICRFRKVGNLR